MLKFSRADTGTIVAAGSALPFIDGLFELFGRREVDLVDYREGISLWRIFSRMSFERSLCSTVSVT